MAKTHIISGGPLKAHEYIEIKKEMSAADDADITNAASEMGGTRRNPKVHLTVGNVKLAALKVMIVNWNLTETVESPIDGSVQEKPIPLSDQAIEELPRRISAYVNKVIDDLNPEDEDDEDFTNAANGSSAGSSQRTKRHQAKA
jgi:hypothetical protein